MRKVMSLIIVLMLTYIVSCQQAPNSQAPASEQIDYAAIKAQLEREQQQ